MDLSRASLDHFQIYIFSTQEDHAQSPFVSVLTILLELDDLIQHQASKVFGTCLAKWLLSWLRLIFQDYHRRKLISIRRICVAGLEHAQPRILWPKRSLRPR